MLCWSWYSMLICAIFNSVETSFEPRLIPDTDRFTGNFPYEEIWLALEILYLIQGPRKTMFLNLNHSLLVQHVSFAMSIPKTDLITSGNSISNDNMVILIE
jgi:hypothetical protein